MAPAIAISMVVRRPIRSDSQPANRQVGIKARMLMVLDLRARAWERCRPPSAASSPCRGTSDRSRWRGTPRVPASRRSSGSSPRTVASAGAAGRPCRTGASSMPRRAAAQSPARPDDEQAENERANAAATPIPTSAFGRYHRGEGRAGRRAEQDAGTGAAAGQDGADQASAGPAVPVRRGRPWPSGYSPPTDKPWMTRNTVSSTGGHHAQRHGSPAGRRPVKFGIATAATEKSARRGCPGDRRCGR